MLGRLAVLLAVAGVAAGTGIMQPQGGSYAQDQARNAQSSESGASSSVEYLDGPLAPLYDFLEQRRLTKFCKLLRDAQLEDHLVAVGGFWTVFAPTDASFVSMPEGSLQTLQQSPQLLRDFLLYHFVVGDFPTSQIQNEVIVDSLQGAPLRFNVYGQIVTVSGSQILEPDVEFEQGRVHVIDRPLYPIPRTDTVSYLANNHQRFHRLLQENALADYVSSGTFTILAPNDEAFNYLSQELKETLNANRTLTEKVLLNHVLPGSLYTGGISDGMQWETMGGDVIIFTTKRGIIFANGIPIIIPDVPFTNGVIHVLNRVLLPEGIESDCHCKPTSDAPLSPVTSAGVQPPAFGQTQRPRISTRAPSQQGPPRQTPRPPGRQTHSPVVGRPTPRPAQPRVPSQQVPQSRPVYTPRPVASQTTRQPLDVSLFDFEPEDDQNAVNPPEVQIGGQKRPDQSRTTRYPSPPQRGVQTPRPQPPRVNAPTTRTTTRWGQPQLITNVPNNEGAPVQGLSSVVTSAPVSTSRWWNPPSQLPRQPTPVSPNRFTNRPPTRRPATTWSYSRPTVAVNEKPGDDSDNENSILTTPHRGLQTQRPGVSTTTVWQNRRPVATQGTRRPTHSQVTSPSKVPPPRAGPQLRPGSFPTPAPILPEVSDQPFDSNRQCRRQGERITPSNQNLQICTESEQPCQRQPYNPNDPRPLCPNEIIITGCQSPNVPFNPSDSRPPCEPQVPTQGCRNVDEPSYTGDRRPLCSVSSSDPTGCRDPSLPFNPSDNRPPCATASPRNPSQPSQRPPAQGCRPSNEPAYPGDARPACPEERGDDCRPFNQRPTAGDRRPLCPTNRQPSPTNRQPSPHQRQDHSTKGQRPLPPNQQRPPASGNNRFPTQSTRVQSWRTSTNSPRITTPRQQSIVRPAAQPNRGLPPAPQPQRGNSFQTRPQPGFQPNQPNLVSPPDTGSPQSNPEPPQIHGGFTPSLPPISLPGQPGLPQRQPPSSFSRPSTGVQTNLQQGQPPPQISRPQPGSHHQNQPPSPFSRPQTGFQPGQPPSNVQQPVSHQDHNSLPVSTSVPGLPVASHQGQQPPPVSRQPISQQPGLQQPPIPGQRQTASPRVPSPRPGSPVRQPPSNVFRPNVNAQQTTSFRPQSSFTPAPPFSPTPIHPIAPSGPAGPYNVPGGGVFNQPQGGHRPAGAVTTNFGRGTTARSPISVTGSSPNPGEDSRRTLYEIVEDPSLLIRGTPVKLNKIFSLFQKAGLEDILTGPGPNTVFLPSDDAFATLPKGAVDQLEENPELLRQVLLYHVANTEILPSGQPESYTVPSLEGTQLLVTMSQGGKLIVISGAKAIAVTRASNGIFYVVNQLLYPLPHVNIVSAILSRPDLSTLAWLLPQSGLQDLLQGQTAYTFLAPTDNAFAQLPPAVLEELTRNTTALQEILLNHIIDGAHYGREFLTGITFPSARGGKLKFQVVSYGYQVNDINIKTPEIVTGTGVIHLIDQVLLEKADQQYFSKFENTATDPSQNSPTGQGLPGNEFQTLGNNNNNNNPRPGSRPSTSPGQQWNPGQPQVTGLQPHSVQAPGSRNTHGQNAANRPGSRQQPTPGSPNSPAHMNPGQPGQRSPGQPNSQGQRSPGQPNSPGQRSPGLHNSPAQNQPLNTNRRPATHAQARVPGQQPGSPGASGVTGQPNDVADLTRSMGLSRFSNWISNTGLLEKIHDGGVYTVFAPTDEAVNSLPQEMVQSIDSSPEQTKSLLQYHIVPQTIDVNALSNEQTTSTLLQGKTIRFNVYPGNGINCKQLVTASGTPVGDALARLGSVQVIPVTQVLYQPAGTLLDIADSSPLLTSLSQAVRAANINWLLAGTGPLTFFAPSDVAFQSLSAEDRKNLIDDKQAFSELLKRHLIRGTFFSSGVQEDLEMKTENNQPISLSLQGGILTANSIPVTFSDITATNGVLHVVDRFL